jgi:NADH-quinone oxidoreductase subunit M
MIETTSSGLGLLTLLAALPLLGSIVVALLPRHDALLAKRVALFFAVATFALALVSWTRFDSSDGGYQLVESVSWIPALGVSWTLGVDGIALILVLMATFLVPIVIIAGWNEVEDAQAMAAGRRTERAAAVVGSSGGSTSDGGVAVLIGGGPTSEEEQEAPSTGSVKGYFALFLATEALMLGVFLALDVFVFYVFFEAILIPVYFLIGRYGSGHRAYAAMKFLIYSLVGGLLMLAALAGLWAVTRDAGGPTFDLRVLTQVQLPENVQTWLFLGFFIAFAIKAPLWPLHTWLPDASGSAQPMTAVLLIGILDKIGTFGVMRLCLPLFPDAAQRFAPWIIALSVVSILYGALLAVGQTDMRRLFAYVSVSHFGFMMLGIFVFTSSGQTGSTFYMLGHGLSTALLFCTLAYLMRRRGSSLIADYGGVAQVAPVLAGFFLIANLTALALPGMSTFISEFLVLLGTFERYPWVAVVATLGIVLSALYALWLVQRVNFFTPGEAVARMRDLSWREVAAVAPVAAVVIVLGFYPKPALDVINPAVDQLMQYTGTTDPAPAVEGVTP